MGSLSSSSGLVVTRLIGSAEPAENSSAWGPTSFVHTPNHWPSLAMTSPVGTLPVPVSTTRELNTPAWVRLPIRTSEPVVNST